jgi:hypothetical protein
MPPRDYFEEQEDIFGEYNYLTYMAQNASKGAPLPVYWSMAEEKSGDFNEALDDYIETSVYPPQAGENQPTRWDLPGEEEDWWDYADFFIPEEGAALQDSFDAMEDGDMEQGLDDLEDIVSSTIPTYASQPGSSARFDPPFPVTIDEPDAQYGYDTDIMDAIFAEAVGAMGVQDTDASGLYGMSELQKVAAMQAEKIAAQGPPRTLPVDEIPDILQGPFYPGGPREGLSELLNGSQQPVGYEGGGWPFLTTGLGFATKMIADMLSDLQLNPYATEPSLPPNSSVWERLASIEGGEGIGSDILYALGLVDPNFNLPIPEKWPMSPVAVPTTTDEPIFTDPIWGGDEGLGDMELGGDPSYERKIFAGFDAAYPNVAYIQEMMDQSDLDPNQAGATLSDLLAWLEWGGRRREAGDEDFLNDLREAGILPPTTGLDGEPPPATGLDGEQPPVIATPTPTTEPVEDMVSGKHEDFRAAEEAAKLLSEKPSYADQFTRIFNNIPGSQRIEAQSGMTAMFDDAEMLFYLSEDWGAKEGASREWLTGNETTNPSLKLDEQARKEEEGVFANWVQNTYLQNPRQTRYGEEFYNDVRGLRDRMFQIKDLTMEELYDTLTSDWEKAPGYALGDPSGRGKEGQYQQTQAQAKKTVMDRFTFMDPDSSTRLAQLVGMYNIHPGTDHWLKAEMMNFYSNMMKNWKASGRDSYDFINAFVGDRPAMPGGIEDIGKVVEGGVGGKGMYSPLLPDGGVSTTGYSLSPTGGAALDPVNIPKAYEPIPHGMVRMGGRNGEIITLDELRRRVKRRVKPSLEKDDIVEEWTSEFEDILSGLKWGD